MTKRKAPEGFFDALGRIIRGSSDIMNDVLRIALLEWRIVRLSALYIVIWGFILLIFFGAAWLCLQAVLVLILNHFLTNLMLSFAIVLGFNLILAAIATIIIIRMSRDINFQTTQKQLQLLK